MVDVPSYAVAAKTADLRAKVLAGEAVSKEELRDVIDLMRTARTAATLPTPRARKAEAKKTLTLDDL